MKENPFPEDNGKKVNSSNKMSDSVLQVESSIYFRKKYDGKGQFSSYWHQINEIFSLDPKSVLEIGKGSGLVSAYLKRRGVNIRTLDIDKGLNPDVVGSVLSIPFKKNAFEVVDCYEVLEHLPYQNFEKALQEIFRVCEKYAVLSLPQDIKKTYRVLIDLPGIKGIKKIISLSNWKKPINPFSKEHHWEIGLKGLPLSRITNDIKKVGFVIEKTYRVFEKLFHRFFILKKMNQHN